MLAGLWLAYVSFGLVAGGISPLVVFVSEDLNLSRSSMGSVMGAWPLVYIAFAIQAGALIDRLGLRGWALYLSWRPKTYQHMVQAERPRYGDGHLPDCPAHRPYRRSGNSK